jgi:hypothetical protein
MIILLAQKCLELEIQKTVWKNNWVNVLDLNFLPWHIIISCELLLLPEEFS